MTDRYVEAGDVYVQAAQCPCLGCYMLRVIGGSKHRSGKAKKEQRGRWS